MRVPPRMVSCTRTLWCLLPMEGVRWAFPCAAWRPCRAEWLLAARLVQPEEKDRIGQFVFARDAKAAMVGRLMMRKLIAEKLNIPWNNILLQRTSKGKPVLVNDSFSTQTNFNFNISHQGDYAVLAAEPKVQVGIDIMKTTLPGRSSIPEFFRIMNRQFTEREWKTIKAFENEWSQLDTFYRHWALKESFLKAIGVGIGFKLQRIEFNISPLHLEVGKVYRETNMLLDGEEEEEWAFEESRLDEYHHIAVALKKPLGLKPHNPQVLSQGHAELTMSHFTFLTFEDLVASAVPLTPEDPSYWDNFCSKQEEPLRNSRSL
ncbi:L-aminoadipate-semialdehyde dehydrogenase-phosphopantetheinyl transferase [Dromiciops gliroides]|uniref:L-aminoadipate-semialdehyde dehydrogenase-phosphopantetheinyl transferase n=1 Tax=Dromiciops gliroides TaxID=33562 RepID=UPI001CC75DFC|nr:L-aminoadipate-semialdehyde dehydrogenase-phosphopantetheinyl transferase [Dromiciops gliroides]